MGKTVQVYGFPSTVSVVSVKGFLELCTGEGTVYAFEVWQPKRGGSRFYADVQFTTTKDAERIISLADNGLWYGKSYLKARFRYHDIISKPRTFSHSMENIKLMFGCQISKERFGVLWERMNVSVKFETGMRRLHFFLSYRQTEYKLDLLYENIWQIELHCPQGQNEKYFLIQLYGAPRIYEKGVCSSRNILEDPLLKFFKDATDVQWVRAIDFTPSCSIGQSSALCLELPCGIQLPNFQKYFPYYRRTKGNFTIYNDVGFSSNLDLIPIVSPPVGIDLPYNIVFMVNRLVQHGCLPGSRLNASFYQMVDPSRINIIWIEHALEKLFNKKECSYEPSSWLFEEYKKYCRRSPIAPAISLDNGLVYVRRVQITPCKVFFCGPEVNVSNRVLRNYPEDIDNFLRVSFVDEEMEKIHSTDLSPRMSSANEARRTGIYERILAILKNGLVIGDKKFEFLAFSSSQLQENSAWMFASRHGLTAADIRTWMGDFRQIRNVAKYAARLGQSFSSSTETLSVGWHEIEIIPDVKVKRGGIRYVFSDGIGKISSKFARKVAIKLLFHPLFRFDMVDTKVMTQNSALLDVELPGSL